MPITHNSEMKSRRNTKIGRKKSVPRLTFRTSSKVKRSKVKVTRPLNAISLEWQGLQVTICKGYIVLGLLAILQAAQLLNHMMPSMNVCRFNCSVFDTVYSRKVKFLTQLQF